jgi:hypothetical protein
MAHRVFQRQADGSALSAFDHFVPQVDQFHCRKRPAKNSVRELQQPAAARLGSMPTFE